MRYRSIKGVKKVKIFKKVNCRIENLKTEILLYFFKSLFWNNQWSLFTNSYLLLPFRRVTYLYLFLLVLLGLFDQTSVTKLKLTIVFHFFIHRYVFEKLMWLP